jgi:hypothetical protein
MRTIYKPNVLAISASRYERSRVMAEIYNFSPEFVSKAELSILADWYTEQIKITDGKIADAKDSVEYKQRRREKFVLMRRRYWTLQHIKNRQKQLL